MSNTTRWYDDFSDYISGALFGLITLDLFMLMIHGISKQSIADYGMGALAITIPIMLVWCFERLYAKQERL